MYYNLKERQRRFSLLGLVLVRNSVEVRTPFSDNDLIDFTLKIPPKFKIGKHLYKKMILSMFPLLRKCPYQATGLSLDPPIFQRITYIFLKRIERKINEISLKIFKVKIFLKPGIFMIIITGSGTMMN